jgi:hypothetical protein
MLQEVKDVRQIPGDLRRRWFCDDYFDLIVWFDPAGSFQGFQLCYDRKLNPRALTWLQDKGYRHNGIDDGEGEAGGHKSSPILVSDGAFSARTTGDRLAEAGACLPEEILGPVLAKVREYKI